MTRIDSANALGPLGDSSAFSCNNETATVRLGENRLSDVAQRLSVDLEDLRNANPGVSDSSNLKVGQELRLPGSQAGLKCEHDQDHERSVQNECRFPRCPIADPLVEGAIKHLLEELGFGNCGRGKQPIDADRISFGHERLHHERLHHERFHHERKPIDADRISFRHEPIDADRISFCHDSAPLDADKISFHHERAPIDADKISFGHGE